MKPKVRLILRDPKAKGSTAILMLYAWGFKDEKGRYRPLKYSTRQSVHANNWNGEKAVGKYAANINNELDKITVAADEIYLKLKGEYLTPQLFKDELDIKLGRATLKQTATRKRTYVRDYILKYISDAENGNRKTVKDPTKNITPGSIRNFNSFRTKFAEFEQSQGKKYTFEDIDHNWYKTYVSWLDKSHKKNTVGGYVKRVISIMQAAFNEDLHNNLEFKKSTFKAVTETVDTIYLNNEQVDQLYKFEPRLKGHEKAIDIWLVLALTLQRISDYKSIVDSKNLTETRNGTKVIQFKQQKTGVLVTIPFIDTRLIALFEKYEYNLPTLSSQKVNKYIKEVCREAEIDVEADKVASHTARRSGCTNWYWAAIPDGQIMKVSGHKTRTEFRKYIRVTDEENAEELATHDFFNR